LVELDALELLDAPLPIDPGDVLKVRLHIDPPDRERWPEMQEVVRAWGKKHGYIIHAVIPVLEPGDQKRINHSRTASKSDRDVVKEFAHTRDVDDKTLKTGLFLMDAGKKQ